MFELTPAKQFLDCTVTQSWRNKKYSKTIQWIKSRNSSLWKRVIAWERSRAASGFEIIWGDADRNKQEEFSA